MTLSKLAMHTVVVLLTLLALVVLWKVSLALAIFACSLAIAAALGPLVEGLVSRGVPRSLSLGGTLVVLLTLLLGVVLALFGPFMNDVAQLGQDVTIRLTEINTRDPDHWLLHVIDPWLEAAAGDSEQRVISPEVLGNIASTLAGTASHLFELIASAGVCLALCLYWMIDHQRLERLWFSLLPVRKRHGVEKLCRSMQREIGAYLRSEFVQTLFAVFLLWAGFQVLGLRYAALLAVAATAFSLLPWIGTLIAVTTVMLLSTAKLIDSSAPWLELPGWMAAGHTLLVLCFLEFAVEPKLFKRDRYSPLVTALVTLAMFMMVGVWGLFFGPPVGYAVQIVGRLVYPLVFSTTAESASLPFITERLAELKQRFANETEVPPEIDNLMQRLQAIVASHPGVAATSEQSLAQVERGAIKALAEGALSPGGSATFG